MKRLVAGTIAAVVLVLVPCSLIAQSKTFTSEMRTETATVEAIDASTRAITLKKADGTYVHDRRGPGNQAVRRDQGRRQVTARYYDNLVIRVKQPGEPDVAVKGSGARPAPNRRCRAAPRPSR